MSCTASSLMLGASVTSSCRAGRGEQREGRSHGGLRSSGEGKLAAAPPAAAAGACTLPPRAAIPWRPGAPASEGASGSRSPP